MILPVLFERWPLPRAAALILLALLGGAAPASAADRDQLRQELDSWSAGYRPEALGEPLLRAVALADFYTERQFALAWFVDRRLTAGGLDLLRYIGAVSGDGLDADDYHWRRLHSLVVAAPLANRAAWDLLLSDAFLALAGHLQSGRVDPVALNPDWPSRPPSSDPAALLHQALAGADPVAVLEALLPRQPGYARLRQQLALLRQMPVGDWQPLATAPLILPGAADPRLEAVSRRLQVLGDLAGYHFSGRYDRELVRAVRQFQSRHGLEPDGRIGEHTLAALNVPPTRRADQVLVNLERWRWLNRPPGTRYLQVNIAAFELRLVDGERTVLQKPVIVGLDYRQTPVFSDLVRYLVFNPSWTVPYRLAVLDKLPEIQRDPGYLEKYGFTLYRAGSSAVVDPRGVDWSRLAIGHFPYRLVQQPGPWNALGQVKFMFPNRYGVYLHDTPSRELFSHAQRAFSSGCIRVADPLVLAEALLRGQHWNRERIDAVVAAGVTETLYLAQPVPIHIEYWTAWVDDAGLLQFRNDIYQRDEPLLAALSEPILP